MPFKFLGILVSANQRGSSTWRPIIENVRRKLSSWKGRHLSIRGRAVLINLVISNIPIYFMSFFKEPK